MRLVDAEGAPPPPPIPSVPPARSRAFLNRFRAGAQWHGVEMRRHQLSRPGDPWTAGKVTMRFAPSRFGNGIDLVASSRATI